VRAQRHGPDGLIDAVVPLGCLAQAISAPLDRRALEVTVQRSHHLVKAASTRLLAPAGDGPVETHIVKEEQLRFVDGANMPVSSSEIAAN